MFISNSSPSAGYIGMSRASKTSSSKVKESTKDLFRSLHFLGPLAKKNCSDIMARANGRYSQKMYPNYCGSTIAWHITNGRLDADEFKGRTMISLTSKGLKYAKDRGII
jgi:hypothetical protein